MSESRCVGWLSWEKPLQRTAAWVKWSYEVWMAAYVTLWDNSDVNGLSKCEPLRDFLRQWQARGDHVPLGFITLSRVIMAFFSIVFGQNCCSKPECRNFKASWRSMQASDAYTYTFAGKLFCKWLVNWHLGTRSKSMTFLKQPCFRKARLQLWRWNQPGWKEGPWARRLWTNGRDQRERGWRICTDTWVGLDNKKPSESAPPVLYMILKELC